MASPQLEKGYVRIANELFERLYQSCIPGREHRAMEFILRVTYGYARTMAEVSSSELGEEIDCHCADARKLLSNLVSRNMLIRVAEARGRKAAVYKINKNWERWKHERRTPWPPLREKTSRGADTSAKNPSGGADTSANTPKTPRQTWAKHLGKYPQNTSATIHNLPESIATPDTLKQKTENSKTDPPYPRGEIGGGLVPLRKKEIKQSEFLTEITGIPPTRKNLKQVTEVCRSTPPPGWHPTTWRKHSARTLQDILRQVASEHQAGAQFGSVYGVACSRASQRLASDARTPHLFEGDYDESA